jgi:hypothetical protein
MIRTEISTAAYDAIITSSMRLLVMGAQRSPQGSYFFWLDDVTLNGLTAAKGPSEDLSDVFIRMADVFIRMAKVEARAADCQIESRGIPVGGIS